VKPKDGDGDNLKKTRCLFTIVEKQEIRHRIEADIETYRSKKLTTKSVGFMVFINPNTISGGRNVLFVLKR
jgi:hypothetical protein